LQKGEIAICNNCGSRLFGNPKGGLESALPLMMSALPLFLIANVFPILTLRVGGLVQSTSIAKTSFEFFNTDMWMLGIVVLFTTVIAPAVLIIASSYALLALRYGRALPLVCTSLKLLTHLKSWGMMDVFILAIVVALVKLVGLASVILGTGLYSYVATVFVVTLALNRIEPHLIWARFEELK